MYMYVYLATVIRYKQQTIPMFCSSKIVWGICRSIKNKTLIYCKEKL